MPITLDESGHITHKTPVCKALKCAHCGLMTADAHFEYRYIGGRGDCLLYYCDDRDACWKRFEELEA